MKINKETAKRVARLARIGIKDEQLEAIAEELTKVVDFMDQLNEVKVAKIISAGDEIDSKPVYRNDKVSDGNYQHEILKNAPSSQAGFFSVTKVIE